MSRHSTPPILPEYWVVCDTCGKESESKEDGFDLWNTTHNDWICLTIKGQLIDICLDCIETITINGRPLSEYPVKTLYV